MGGPSERTIRAREELAAWVRRFADAPRQRAENKTAARLIDLWDARRARGAEPLFAPTVVPRSAPGVRGSRSTVRVVTSLAKLIFARSTGIGIPRSRA